jgi:hypothetical protein
VSLKEYNNNMIDRSSGTKWDSNKQGYYQKYPINSFGNSQFRNRNFENYNENDKPVEDLDHNHTNRSYNTYQDLRETRDIYPAPPQTPERAQNNREPGKRLTRINEGSVTDYFGFIPSIPAFSIAWLISIIILIIIVELDIYLNLLNNDYFEDQTVLVGVTIIGVFLGTIFSYIQYEYKIWQYQHYKNPDRSHINGLKVIILILLSCFLTIEIVVQLVSYRERIGIIDCLGIFAVGCGTYGILVKNRVMIVPTILIIMIIGAFKINYSTDIVLLIILSGFLLFYIIIYDTSIQYYRLIEELRKVYKDKELKKYDRHFDRILTNYLKYLFVFILTSTLILGFLFLLNMYRISYFPEFIRDNLELKTIYGLIGPFIVFLTVVFIIWVIKRYNIKSISKNLIS